jgi:uncharacterized membrane protein YbaN (DUF454 family)
MRCENEVPHVDAIGHTAEMKAGVAKLLWMAAGLAALGAGIVGIFLPLLPTVPFALLAAFCFSRGNKRWERWMLEHPKLGPIIRQWRTHRVVPLKAKLLASVMMAVSSAGAWMTMPASYRWAPLAVCSIVALWLWRLPHAAPNTQRPTTAPGIDSTRTTDGTRDPFVIIVIIALMLSHALPYAWATVTLDTARDLAAAYRIAEGDLVLRGPILNGLFHVGPIWFYVLSPVLVLTKSQALTLLWVGLLAATKIPLAYVLGKSIRDSTLGLCFAVLIASPGWPSMGSVFPTHTVMVESAVLLQALLMYRLAGAASHRHWALLGLASGLALHAHPSATFVLLLIPAVLWMRRRRLEWRDLAAMSAGGALFFVPLMPMLLAEYREAWPALAPTAAFAQRGDHPFGVGPALQILQGTFVEGPRVAMHLTGSTSLVDLLLVAMAIAGVIGLAGNLLREARADRGILVCTSLAIPILALLLSGIRGYTPFYMTLVLLPFGWMAVALGMSRLPGLRIWLLSCATLVVAGSAILIASAESGEAHINVARLSNVRNAVPKPVNAALLPAWQLDALSRTLCDGGDDVVLHGYLALLYDASLGLGPELRCHRPNAAAFAGSGARGSSHWLGLPPVLALKLGIQTGGAWNDTPKHDVQPLSPSSPLQPADRKRYPHHVASGEMAGPHRWSLQSHGQRRMLITTDLLYPYRVNRVEQVLANGAPARKVAEMNVTQVWLCDHCDTDRIDWEVVALSNDPDVLDIVATSAPRTPAEKAGR